MAKDHKKQKDALAQLLRNRFGKVDRERRFDWMAAPTDDMVSGDYAAIIQVLCKHRGFPKVYKPGHRPFCDFVIESQKLIIEFDEEQHFTQPRKITLKHYPADVKLSFSQSDWIRHCEKRNRHDNHPPERDERRAFYDAVRDIAAFRNGYKLIRLKKDDIDWLTATDADLDTVIK